jgi:selenocysteine lyase/cysteine desulfurase
LALSSITGEIVVSIHISNILPWREANFEVIQIGIDAEGGIDIVELESELKRNQSRSPIIGSFSACSNITGILFPRNLQGNTPM